MFAICLQDKEIYSGRKVPCIPLKAVFSGVPVTFHRFIDQLSETIEDRYIHHLGFPDRKFNGGGC